MPAAQRVRAYQQAGPSLSREKQRRRGQDRPVARPELESPALLSRQHPDLVAQNDQLEVALAVRPAREHADEAAQEPVDQQPKAFNSSLPADVRADQPVTSGGPWSFFTQHVHLSARFVGGAHLDGARLAFG